jgi:E3 ubiquitin-protein ligase HUWE1
LKSRPAGHEDRKVRSLLCFKGSTSAKDLVCYVALILNKDLTPPPDFFLASLSPERAEDSDALTAVSSQLEGSPMDTSSLASCTLEEAVGDSATAGSSEQPTAGSSTPGDAPPVVAEAQGRADVSGESTQPPEDR